MTVEREQAHPGDRAFLEQIDRYGRLVFSSVGDSMYPMLRSARDVVVLARPQGPLRRLDVALYRDDAGVYVLHRVFRLKPEGVVFWGDGRMEADTVVPRDRVLAVVTEFYRENRLISARSPFYRAYARAWCALWRMRGPMLRACYRARRIKAFFRKERHRAQKG